MKKLILPALLTIASGINIAFPTTAHSQMMSACGDVSGLTDAQFASSNSNGCAQTPEKYEIVIYEMGLCTGSSPISGGTLDRTNCTATYANAAGQTVDLAGSNSVTLDSSNSTKPTPNTYTWGYMVMKNTFGLKGSISTSQSTWRSTSNSMASKSSSTNADFTESLTNFDGSGGCDSSASATMSLGTMSAILTDSDLVEDTSCTSSNITRLVGAFSPTTAYTITPATTAVKMTFTVTNNGMSVIPNPSSPFGVAQFGSGPFQMEITTIE
tara:strand:+ start:38 stop:844 length:807 start_codon:yes stop_codon:yes gene_type:complete